MSAVLAQDVMKVAGGPETHKVILDNDQVRILDVHIQPGQKVEMHSHPANTVYYQSACKLKATGPEGKSQVADHEAGTAIWRAETKHAAENVGSTECHLIQTELKGKK